MLSGPAPRPGPLLARSSLRCSRGCRPPRATLPSWLGRAVGDAPVVDLTRTEFDLLAALASRPGRVLQRETLLREVWRTEWAGSLRLVEAHMSNLRRKLSAAGLQAAEIRTVRGVGYRLVA